MYILIGADVVPTKNNIDLFNAGDSQSLLGDDLKKILGEAEYRIFNLEVPLTDRETPIIKQGPTLIAPTSTIAGYKSMGVDLLTLANNHILDQGVQGLKSTIEVLDQASISHVGAGAGLDSAMQPYIFKFSGKKIGIYACAEHEFSIAGENSPGANPFEPLWSLDHVEELKRNVDYVIVLYHGGKEHYRYPSPNLQKTCRRLVDKGADLVICQHSHCIGCEEKYKDGTIVYGQGNFLFDHKDDECWKTSLLISINENFSISYIPLEKKGATVRLAESDSCEKIMRGFSDRSRSILETGFIEKKYSEFASTFLDFYLRALSGKRNIVQRILNRLTNGRYIKRYLMHTYKRTEKLRIMNYLDCEAHRDLLSRALKNEFE